MSDLNAASPRRKRNLCGIVTLCPRSPCDCVRVYLLFSRHEKQRERPAPLRVSGRAITGEEQEQQQENHLAADRKCLIKKKKRLLNDEKNFRKF